ncbi:carcinoembryonic antigen-related cell adhesion molecule 1 [Nerophis ophidion]|uniref:carcinoembryonic antigen-related cell adhesion molecule 1 n=1 Tax=Nerophis ophidion TaxID=159077 RepID=UPI002ADFEF97|nr:carcinoembryonic antigen-related cell adhesion molecule 1 [Nerophis ophidion]
MARKTAATKAGVLLFMLQAGLGLSAAVQVLPSANPVAVGDTLTLSLHPATALRGGSWAVGDFLILTWLGEQQAVFPNHSGRASVDVITAALTLTAVTLEDSGVYAVQSSDPPFGANASITVLEPVSNVTFSVNQTHLSELSTAAVTCSASSGSSPSFLWLNGSSEVVANERVALTDENATLSILGVSRHDRGPFRCFAFNPVSNGTSDFLTFTITYGPDNMVLTVNGNATSFLTGSNLTMFCSAQSSPPALLQWAFRGQLLNSTGPSLKLFDVSQDQSGLYGCLAYNNETNRSSNITKDVVISKSHTSALKQHAFHVWLVPMMHWVGFLLALLDAGGLLYVVHGQGLSASQNPIPVGQNVTFSSLNVVDRGAWLFNSELVILIILGTGTATPNWKDRVAFNSTTSSLTIASVKLNESGTYTLQDVTSGASQLVLSVQVPITGVNLAANGSNLVEFNDTVVLTCTNITGTSLSFKWLNDTSEVTAGGNVQISANGSKLTIARVTRYDQGPFRCNVSNGISQGISSQVLFNISYGPTNPQVSVTPSKYTHITGSNITLSCSAESKPTATIQWLMNGTNISHSDPQLVLSNVTKNHTGDYQCLLHNSVTSSFKFASAMISIMAPITAVMVNHTGVPAIAQQTFALECHVTGMVHLIQWWMNGNPVSADNTTLFTVDNKTLTLNPAQPSDAGDYQCQAFNAVSNMTSSPYTVEVYYGPYTPVITAPAMGLTGTSVMLNCSSSSHPPSQHTWYFNNTVLANTSVYHTGPLVLNMSGTYTCMAFNNITGTNSTANHTLTVLTPVTMTSVNHMLSYPILNHNFTLTCDTTGDVYSITWMHNDTLLESDAARSFSMNNATLTFEPVLIHHGGNYSCYASNPLSSLASDNFTLAVVYGPGVPTVTAHTAALVGSSVALSCNASSHPPSQYMWYFNKTVVANSSVYHTPPLSSDMSGPYTCKALNAITGYNTTASTTITVYDKIKEANITVPMSPAIEGYPTTLTCNVSGTPQQVLWMKDGVPLMADNRTSLSMDNLTVTFNPLSRNDSGMYHCYAINPLQNVSSPSHWLLVNFGPENLMVYGPALAVEGQSVNFSCSAVSVPPSHFYWLHNGSIVANSSVFVSSSLSLNMSGNYTCMAQNPLLKRNSTKSLALTVKEAIKSVMVMNDTIPIDGNNFTLTCVVDGHYDSIQWEKNGTYVGTNMSADNHTYYHLVDNSFFFTPLMRSDDDEYRCVASNLIGPHESPPYELLVNYGPLSVTLSDPELDKEKLTITVKCEADSRPEPEIKWFLNDKPSEIGVGNMVQISLSLLVETKYSCRARNPVTNITMTQTKTFSLFGSASALPSPSQRGLFIASVFILSVPVLFR